MELQNSVLKIANLVDFIEPEDGLEYSHFKLQEIFWLFKDQPSVEYKIDTARRFINKYPDLKELSENISVNMLKHAKKGEFPHWYILKLVEFKRYYRNLIKNGLFTN